MRSKIDQRFAQPKQTKEVENAPAFDLVRASVNLMMASVLIAFATSLKLPLSTTYVSFMVAMGTSLADRAWDRDSAVYRVAGVVNVIGGWLFTALIAFVAAGLLALTIHYGGMVAIVALMLLTGYLIIRSQFLHKKRSAKTKHYSKSRKRISGSEVYDESKYHVSVSVFKLSYVLGDLVKGLRSEDKKVVEKAKEEVTHYRSTSEELQIGFYHYLKRVDSPDGHEGQFYLHALNHLQNISQSVALVSERIFDHLINLHKPMQLSKQKELDHLTKRMSAFLLDFSELMMDEQEDLLEKLEVTVLEIESLIDQCEQAQIKRVRTERSSPKNSLLFITILLEYRDMLTDVKGLIGMYLEQDAIHPSTPPNVRPVFKLGVRLYFTMSFVDFMD